MQQESMKSSLIASNRSPLNTSKGKAMYTFPKDERFPNLGSECNSSFYQKNNTLSKRAPSFGYGNKSDIALIRNSPSPDRYNLSSGFQTSPKKGLTIGQGRDDCKSITIFNHSNVPGPGNYNLHKASTRDVTMSPKFKFPSLWSNSLAPGPGAYQTQKVDKNGSCLISKFKSKNSFKILSRSPEKENKDAQKLGPGTYDTNMSSTGKQLLARNKTEKAFVFSKKVRETMNEQTLSPGPGAYGHFSMFGLK